MALSNRMFAWFGLYLGAALSGSRASAQASSDSAALFTTLAARDSAVFDAFNRCDIPAFASFLTEDLEFYHDFNGLAKPRSKLIEGITEECRAKRLGRRELVPGSLEVHPIRGYGAIQIGVHRFFVRTPTGERPGSTARFTHVWENRDGTWRIARVLSFDHKK
jgi:ketosteroid isomerase-like protein